MKTFNPFFFSRHVMLPPDIAELVPRNHLMTETEWRNIGVEQSPFWVHYMVHTPGNTYEYIFMHVSNKTVLCV